MLKIISKNKNILDSILFKNCTISEKSQCHKKFSSASNLAYCRGSSNIPLLNLTIGQKFRESAEKYKNRLAITCPHEQIQWTYGQLQEESEAIAAGLLSLGLKKGARVGVYGPNLAHWTALQLGASLADLILVNINPNYLIDELEFALNKVQCEALVMTCGLKNINYDGMINKLAPELNQTKNGQELISKKLPNLKWIIKLDNTAKMNSGTINLNDISNMGRKIENIKHLKEVESQICPEDPTSIQFTSGTTGFPKAALLSHYSIINNSHLIGRRLNYTENDTICMIPPNTITLACRFKVLFSFYLI